MNVPTRAAAARRLRWSPVLALALLVAACAGPGAASPTAPPPVPTAITQGEAVARVLAQDPRFAGIGPADPDLIGQAAWYEVTPAAAGWRVVVTIGWGDCPAGCINRHTWVYEVDGTGAASLVEETGDPLEGTSHAPGTVASPPVPIPSDGGAWIVGRALAGPVCPVAQDPPDPACDDRPVAGATVVIRDADGARVAEVVTSDDGTFLVALPAPGFYIVEGQPVEGLLGTPAPVEALVGEGSWSVADLGYDTGIR